MAKRQYCEGCGRPAVVIGDADRQRFDASVRKDPDSGCWEWTRRMSGHNHKRRPSFTLAGKAMIAARAAWAIFHGRLPGEMHVCHRCDNPMCVNPDHLYLGTHAQNMRDARGRGQLRVGARHPSAKATSQDVWVALKLIQAGWTRQEVGIVIGVSDVTVGNWVRGKARLAEALVVS